MKQLNKCLIKKNKKLNKWIPYGDYKKKNTKRKVDDINFDQKSIKLNHMTFIRWVVTWVIW